MKTGKNILMGIALTSALFVSAQEPVDYVNPFVGTTNYGTTNPGAVVPQGMMSSGSGFAVVDADFGRAECEVHSVWK